MKHLTMTLLLAVCCLLAMAQPPKVNEQLFDAVVVRGGSIQQAIDNAPEHPTAPYKILVKKGLYHEKVIIDRPNIVLVGENRDSGLSAGNGIPKNASATSGMCWFTNVPAKDR